MRNINKLIIKVKRMYEPRREKLIYVMLGYNRPNSVSCIVWNGIKRQARTLEFDCSTREEALKRVEEVFKEYPNRQKVHGIDLDKNARIVIESDEA